MYQPDPVNFINTVQELLSYLVRQLQLIANAFDRGIAREVEFRDVAPTKPRLGLLTGADGANWNPGEGQGVYCYYGGAWVRLRGTGGAGTAWGSITGTLSNQTDLQSALGGKSDTGHNHDAIYSVLGHGHAQLHDAVTIADSTSIDLTLTGQQISAAAIFGSTSGTVAEGNHTHAQLHDAVTVADSTSIDLTLTGQQVSAAAIFGSTSGTVAEGNHTHAQLHDAVTVADSSSIDLTLTGQQLSATAIFGTTVGTVCQGNDSRLSDARTPTAHNQAWSTITGAPTTLSGYGITDAQPLDTQLTDLAALSYTANGLKVVRVNAGATAFELATLAASGDVTGDDTSTTAQNIVAYSGTGGKNITELTGTQGDVLYHNGTNWAKLAAGTDGYFLRASGAGANPKWWPAAVYNQSTANQGAGFSTDTYVTGSNVLIPASSLKVGTRYLCVMRVSKTAAGTATPIINIRFGTGASTSDTSRGTLTWTAGTAAADDGMIEIWMTVTATGASGTIRTVGRITHRLSVTGLTGTAATSETEVADSGAFNTTVANSYIGISLNAGTSAAWTVHLVQAQMENFA